MNIPFSELLESLVEKEYGHNNRRIVNLLYDKGVNISMRSLQRYRASSSIPSLLIASEIINCLDPSITLDEIKESILLEKEKQEKLDSDNSGIMNKFVSFKIKEMDSGIGLGEYDITNLIDNRIKELYGNNKRGFSKYIEDLVIKDLKEYILTTAERKQNG